MMRVSNLIGTYTQDQLTLDRVLRGVEIVLVILLAVALARLAVDLIPSVPGNAGNSEPSGQVDLRIPATGLVAADADRISPALRQLFGKADGATVSVEETEQPLQQTTLNLILKGILADSVSDNRLALISVGENKEKVYRVDDQIEGAEIIRIESRRVIIRRNGVTEALDLEVKKLDPSASPTRINTPPERVSFSNGIRKLGDNQWSMSRTTLKQQLSNLPALLQQATAVPYSEGGQPAGFRIVDLQQGSVFQQLGIQQNDIINSVNGSSIRTIEEALNAYRNLGTASAFQVGVIRAGQQINLNLSVE